MLPAPSSRPNIVYLVLDDLGFADLGCYGSEIATPAVDRLASNGLRYTNFHTSAMCAPTRAALLTGRQSHAVGMGVIPEWLSGEAGYTGTISPAAATLAEMLAPEGYRNYAVGKWHLMPQYHASPAGPFDEWPLQRGFHRWYGFHGALANQWFPELFEDNHAIDPELPDGYHLSEDLVDRSIGYLRDHLVGAPESPFFLHLALGAVHWPHQVPERYIERYRGRYDGGWDEIRAERLARQKELGVVPPDTELAPRNPGEVVAWAELGEDERRVFARMQEVYAGWVEHTDEQIGRLLAHLESEGLLENTVVMLVSDNGASNEGGPTGSWNGRKRLVYGDESVQDKLDRIDLLGGPRSYGHYPWGWAQTSNTPLKWYKKFVHGGGIRDPFILHWPGGIPGGGIRHQFHHVSDAVPTVLEILGMDVPERVKGVEQMPLHGVSMRYSFTDETSPSAKTVQYFEMLGSRAIWKDGWKAVTKHKGKGTPFEADDWELYHLDSDFSEVHDLAAQHPEKLRELQAAWDAEAAEYHVLPLNDLDYERHNAVVARLTRQRTVYRPGMSRLDRYLVPDITDGSYTITAELGPGQDGAEGVLLAIGSWAAGCVLYVQDGRAHFEYAYDSDTRRRVSSTVPVGPTVGRIRLRFERTGPGGGTATLEVDDEYAGSVDVPDTWPAAALAGGLYCGRDGGTAVGSTYELPFAYSGPLHRVSVEVEGSGTGSAEADLARALGEQ